MSRFRKVAAGTWGDERFRSLSEPAQRLWLYLLTGNEVTSLPGILVIGRAGLAEALNWTLPKLDRCFRELTLAKNDEGIPMAKADWRARVVWLPKGYKHNAPSNPNVVRGWKDLWKSVPECELKAEALVVLRRLVIKLGEAFANIFNEVIDTYDAVRERHGLQPSVTPTVGSETVPPLSPQTLTTLSPLTVPAHARTAPAPFTAPDTSRVGHVDPPAGDPPERVVDMGSSRCDAACLAFVSTLAELGWARVPVRERWERQALCDAINVHIRADGTADGVLSELRRAVEAWVCAYGDDSQRTQGWGVRKFSEWLSAGRKGVGRGAIASAPGPTAAPPSAPAEPEPDYTPAELAAIDARLAESVDRLKNAHLEPAKNRGRSAPVDPGKFEQTPAERDAERKRQLAALAAVTGAAPPRVA